MKKEFTFQCSECNKIFTEEIEGDLAEIFDDIQHDAEIGGILFSECPKCRQKKSGKMTDLSVENAEL